MENITRKRNKKNPLFKFKRVYKTLRGIRKKCLEENYSSQEDIQIFLMQMWLYNGYEVKN